MSNHAITILCIVIPILCVIASIVLFFFEQAAQEKEMYDRNKRNIINNQTSNNPTGCVLPLDEKIETVFVTRQSNGRVMFSNKLPNK